MCVFKPLQNWACIILSSFGIPVSNFKAANKFTLIPTTAEI